MFRRLALASAALIGTLACATAASANVVTVRPDAAITPDVYIPGLIGQVEIQYGMDAYSVTTGPFALEKKADGDAFWTGFVSYCLELRDSLNFPGSYETVTPDQYFSDASTANKLGSLVNLIFNQNLGFADNAEAMAVQLVIWEMVEDGAGAFDLAGGTFRVLNPDAAARAGAIWAMVMSGTVEPVRFAVLRSDMSQDQLMALEVVPVPGALLIFLTGIAGMRLAGSRKSA